MIFYELADCIGITERMIQKHGDCYSVSVNVRSSVQYFYLMRNRYKY